ncbi:hypothetical protein [Sphaerisporangium sp. NPDC051011]
MPARSTGGAATLAPPALEPQDTEGWDADWHAELDGVSPCGLPSRRD